MIPFLLLILLSTASFNHYSEYNASNISLTTPNRINLSVTVYFDNPGGHWSISSGDSPGYQYSDSEELYPDRVLSYGYFPTCNEEAIQFHRNHNPQPYCGCTKRILIE
jgi:hypothetical protein